MNEGPFIAEVAALIGDPARANMLCALLDGRAHTAAELAHVAGIGASTASAHLARLVTGGLLAVEKQGRHRYYRLASSEAATALEALSALVPVAAPKARRPGPRDAAMRRCRTCYDHLAGEVAVRLAGRMVEIGWMAEAEDAFLLTPSGEVGLAGMGVDAAGLRGGRRRFAPRCLDWSERRAHLGGALGAGLLMAFEGRGWVVRKAASRVAEITGAGEAGLEAALGLDLAERSAA